MNIRDRWPAAVHLALLLAALSAFSFATPLAAQSIASLPGAPERPSDLVDGEAFRARAIDSFDALVSETLREDSNQRVTEGARTVAEAFREELDRALVELQGDGALTLTEVTGKIESLRDKYEKELLSVTTALRDGHSPPPMRRDFESRSEHSLALLEYTAAERNSPADWGFVLAWVAGGLIVAWALISAAHFIAGRIRETRFKSLVRLLRTLAGPMYLTALTLGLRFGAQEVWLPEGLASLIDTVLEIGLIAAVFWFLWNACAAMAGALAAFVRRTYLTDVDYHLRNVIVRVLRVLVVFGFAATVIHMVLSTSLTGMLTGLGVLGVALYFILRGTLQNIVASFTVMGDKPFREDDLVKYEDDWGHVERIGFRSTRIRTLDGHLITVPNNLLIENAIWNIDARPTIRRRFRIGLVYQTPPDKIREAIEIVRDILSDYEGKPDDQPVHVFFDEFGDYDLQLLIDYHVTPPDWWQAKGVHTEINLQILERFAAAGIDIAYPTQTTRLKFSENSGPGTLEIVPRDEEAGQEKDGNRETGPRKREEAATAAD